MNRITTTGHSSPGIKRNYVVTVKKEGEEDTLSKGSTITLEYVRTGCPDTTVPIPVVSIGTTELGYYMVTTKRHFVCSRHSHTSDYGNRDYSIHSSVFSSEVDGHF